ncbi:MAG: hypothetical protein GVY18_11395 [Bacteroidetes bacterium]|jgi:hypothetical protein|nr:hypothetical protein [Bacteroidota bacterium]
MKELIEKLKRVEQEIALERGSFVLFGLFKQAEGSGNWDVVVAAPWIDPESEDVTRYIFGKLADLLSEDEAVSIRGVFTLGPEEAFVREVVNNYPTNKEGNAPRKQIQHFREQNIAGVDIEVAYVITASSDIMGFSPSTRFPGYTVDYTWRNSD